MIPNLQSKTIYAVHLRAPSVSGGKDWVGSFTQSGEIHTYWGTTGHVIQHASRSGTINSLDKLIKQKKSGKDKYKQIDEYYEEAGWQSQISQANASPSATVVEPVVDWVEAPDASIKWDF